MFIKNENILKENKTIDDLEVLYTIMESNEMIHNITIDMIRVEHNAIISENEEILNEGVKETAKKIIDVLKKFIAKLKEWIQGVVRNFSEKDRIIKIYLKEASKKLKNFDDDKHSFKTEIPILNDKIFAVGGKFDKAMDNAMALMQSNITEFDKQSQMQKDFGVSSISSISYKSDSVEVVTINNYQIENHITIIKDCLASINSVNNKFKKYENSMNEVISKLERMSEGEENPDIIKEAIAKRSILDYLSQLHILGIGIIKFEIERSLSVIKKAVAKIKE